MANQAGGTRMDTVVKLVLIFFISLLSFAVGTFVGKGVSDSEYREAALERGDYKNFRSTASVTEEEHGAQDKSKQAGLSEEEIESLTEEFVKAEKAERKIQAKTDAPTMNDESAKQDSKSPKGYKKYTQAKAKAAKDQPKAAKDQPKVAAAPTKKTTKESKAKRDVASAAKRVANNKAPTKDARKVRKPDSILPTLSSTSVGKYTVQVASYATEKEAQGHAAKLKGKGYSAFYVPAAVGNNTWYRVSVGLFANYKSAMAFRGEFMKEANIKSALVQKIVK